MRFRKFSTQETLLPVITLLALALIFAANQLNWFLISLPQHSEHSSCKSEFPQNWSKEEIIAATRHIASNDNADWRRQENGYFVTEENYNGINVRVVLDKEKTHIITAYPLNSKRNPCPSR